MNKEKIYSFYRMMLSERQEPSPTGNEINASICFSILTALAGVYVGLKTGGILGALIFAPILWFIGMHTPSFIKKLLLMLGWVLAIIAVFCAIAIVIWVLSSLWGVGKI